MKVALVHDYLREYGGAERVVEALHEMWPEAPLYTSFVDKDALGQHWERFKNWDIRTSAIADNWLIRKFHSPLRFLAPLIWGSLDLSGYDVMISSSGWFMCRGVKVKKSAVHICYIHHPPRSLYGYATGSDLQKYWIVRAYATIVNFFLRHYDFETAQKVDYFIANSEETKRRVWKFYRRKATVIYPPINDGNPNFQIPISKQIQNPKSKENKQYFLSVGRLTYSKRVDLAIEACNKLKLPLKIVGKGKEEDSLKKLASQGQALRSKNIEFLGSVSDEELGKLYTGAKALIFCAMEEDFGMVPVEAMSHGVPVIALGQGGVLETVEDPSAGSGQATGVLFREPTVESLVEGIKRFEKLGRPFFAPRNGASAGTWEENCRKQAEKFGGERFKRELQAFVNRAVKSQRWPL